MRFAGKVVAVTGAAGGIGQALCRHFGGEGAAIAALDRSDAVAAFADELAGEKIKARAAVFDVADAGAVADAFARLAADLGSIDILVNNAGVSRYSALARTTPEGWAEDIGANLNGAYNCCYAVLPAMKEKRSGSIVNIGSVNALSALGDAAYSAGKAGMVSMTRSIAVEFGRYNIRCNIVCPGTVRTPIWDERTKRNPEVLEQLRRWYPLRRVIEPIEVMRAVAFLASDEASAITGAVLPVDCGLTAGNIVMARELTLEDF